MTAALPTDYTCWDFTRDTPRRVASALDDAAVVLTPFSPGAMTATFGDVDALDRFGKGNCPETASVATSETGWEDVAAAGFKLPVELTAARIGHLDAHATATWVVYQRIEFPYAHPSTNAASNWTQLAPFQMYHILIEDGAHDQERGPFRVRVNNTAGVTQGHFQTNTARWNGSVASQDVVTHSLITLATLGADAGGVAVELLIEFGYDTRMVALGSAYPYNIRITARSTSLADGSVHQAVTQSDHFEQTGPSQYPTLPRLPATLCGTESYPSLGRSKDVLTTPGGMNGDFTLMFETVRDAAAGMLSVTEAEQWMDYFRDSAEIEATTMQAAHAYTGEPSSNKPAGFLSDVAVGGTFDLSQAGSGIAVAAGTVPMTGLPDRVRGLVVSATSSQRYAVAPAGLSEALGDALAAGYTLRFMLALERPAALTGVFRSYVEWGSAAATAALRIRQDNANNLVVSIVEDSVIVSAPVTGLSAPGASTLALATIWPSQAGLFRIGVQVCNEASYHDGETNKQTLVVDTLHDASLTYARSVLYPDDDPSVEVMRTESTDIVTVGANATGGGMFGGTLAWAVGVSDTVGEIWDQVRMLREVQEFWDSSGNGLIRGTGGGGARNRSRSRARAGAF